MWKNIKTVMKEMEGMKAKKTTEDRTGGWGGGGARALNAWRPFCGCFSPLIKQSQSSVSQALHLLVALWI